MKVSLFGYGVTTKAIAEKFAPNCLIYDDNFAENSYDTFKNKLLMCKEFDAKTSELEIPSPGFPANHELVKKSKNLISEYDFFMPLPKSVWISGTNGKTTTTQMLQHLLYEKGSQAGGNIGTPLAKLNKNSPLWILETSSFTLFYTTKASPDIYLLLPIKADHISWHGSFDAYEACKLKPLLMMSEGSVAIVPDEYSSYPSDAMLIGYKNSSDLAKKFDIDISKIDIKEPFLMDAILAMCAEKILYEKIDYKKINSFKIDRHKLEEFYDARERLWVNDTKATNIDATIEALKRYKDKEIFIILGGDDKGVCQQTLFDVLQNLNVKIFAIGANMKRTSQFAKNINKEVYECKTLDIAVLNIDKLLNKNGVGLLSPAAASLDQFTSYIQRGDLFMSFVNNLKK